MIKTAKGGCMMRVLTYIDVPDYVYLFFQKQAKAFPRKEAEDLMAEYLSRYVRQKKYREEKKQKQEDK